MGYSDFKSLVIRGKNKPQKVLIFLHGYGSDPESFSDVGKYIVENVENTDAVLPYGFKFCARCGLGYEWFPMDSDNILDWKKDISFASNKMIEFLDAVKEKYNITSENIILGGFSQGAMLALDAGIRAEVGHIIAFSGLLVNESVLDQKSMNTKIALIHGDADEVLPLSSMLAAVDEFKERGINVSTLIIPRLNHSIDMKGMNFAVNFLKREE